MYIIVFGVNCPFNAVCLDTVNHNEQFGLRRVLQFLQKYCFHCVCIIYE